MHSTDHTRRDVRTILHEGLTSLAIDYRTIVSKDELIGEAAVAVHAMYWDEFQQIAKSMSDICIHALEASRARGMRLLQQPEHISPGEALYDRHDRDNGDTEP